MTARRAFVALRVWREARALRFEATDITGVDWETNFRRTDHTGRPRTLADSRGKASCWARTAPACR